MSHLEDQLKTGLAERAAGVGTPAAGVFAAAGRRHHRRRALQGTALTTGTLGLAAVLVFSLTGSSPAPSPDRAVALDAQTVSNQVAAALESTEDGIRYLEIHATLDGKSSKLQSWRDDAHYASRALGAKMPLAPYRDYSSAERAGRTVQTTVDRATRTWWVTSFEAPTADERAAWKRDDEYVYSPERIRAATESGGAFTIVGPETIDGIETLHLRPSGEMARDYGDADVWVDAANYELVRREVTNEVEGQGTLSIREDYRTLPRTDANLADLDADVPDGYRKVEQPVPSDKG